MLLIPGSYVICLVIAPGYWLKSFPRDFFSRFPPELLFISLKHFFYVSGCILISLCTHCYNVVKLAIEIENGLA